MTREDFEQVIEGPPYELACYRHPEDPAATAWPGQYGDARVQLAFDVASEIVEPIESRLREYQRALLWCFAALSYAERNGARTLLSEERSNKLAALAAEASEEVEP